ncbi:hypothetical protein [Nonomuraea sp. NPDC052265]|uniref:hypothetical protein n=1 Tax=Nonomuraea sp. NPDC052265 TaxID=3364374 RepID=UPI0037CCBFD7
MTGFPAAVRAAIRSRSMGICEACGRRPATQQHHRDPRGMGGDPRTITNCPCNGLDLDDACHAWIEANRTIARKAGLLLGPGEDPCSEPVLLRAAYGPGWYRLDVDGGAVWVGSMPWL